MTNKADGRDRFCLRLDDTRDLTMRQARSTLGMTSYLTTCFPGLLRPVSPVLRKE